MGEKIALKFIFERMGELWLRDTVRELIRGCPTAFVQFAAALAVADDGSFAGGRRFLDQVLFLDSKDKNEIYWWIDAAPLNEQSRDQLRCFFRKEELSRAFLPRFREAQMLARQLA